jgi:hypothetical protein
MARELAGERLAADHRIRWENAKSSLEMARGFGEFSTLLPAAVGSASDARWFKFPRRNVSDVPDHFRFDADIALALSAMMLNEKNGRAPQTPVLKLNTMSAAQKVPPKQFWTPARSRRRSFFRAG